MEENINAQSDFFDNNLEALPKKPEKPVAQATKKPSLPASSIPLGQKPPACPATPVSWSIKKEIV